MTGTFLNFAQLAGASNVGSGDTSPFSRVVYAFTAARNGSAVSSGVTALDDYIRATYRPVRTVVWYQVWQRK